MLEKTFTIPESGYESCAIQDSCARNEIQTKFQAMIEIDYVKRPSASELRLLHNTTKVRIRQNTNRGC
jgi:hypothetical protein